MTEIPYVQLSVPVKDVTIEKNGFWNWEFKVELACLFMLE